MYLAAPRVGLIARPLCGRYVEKWCGDRSFVCAFDRRTKNSIVLKKEREASKTNEYNPERLLNFECCRRQFVVSEESCIGRRTIPRARSVVGEISRNIYTEAYYWGPYYKEPTVNRKPKCFAICPNNILSSLFWSHVLDEPTGTLWTSVKTLYSVLVLPEQGCRGVCRLEGALFLLLCFGLPAIRTTINTTCIGFVIGLTTFVIYHSVTAVGSRFRVLSILC